MRTKTGAMLKVMREKAGVTQRELATAMGFSTSQYVSNWERGMCSMPSAKAAIFCKKTKASAKVVKQLLLNDASDKLDRAFSEDNGPKKK